MDLLSTYHSVNNERGNGRPYDDVAADVRPHRRRQRAAVTCSEIRVQLRLQMGLLSTYHSANERGMDDLMMTSPPTSDLIVAASERQSHDPK